MPSRFFNVLAISLIAIVSLACGNPGGSTRNAPASASPPAGSASFSGSGSAGDSTPDTGFVARQVNRGEGPTPVAPSSSPVAPERSPVSPPMATVDRATSGGPGATSDGPGTTTGGPGATTGTSIPMTVQLSEQNASGVSGNAVLTDLGSGRTQVVLTIPGDSGNRPAHIHEGTCANLNPAPRYPLSNVANGTSTTEVAASMADLQQGTFAINVHMSPDQANVYVACGDLR
jgi:hypothetical protein